MNFEMGFIESVLPIENYELVVIIVVLYSMLYERFQCLNTMFLLVCI
jgi:hypothetical protein